jgi:hypothetical protein
MGRARKILGLVKSAKSAVRASLRWSRAAVAAALDAHAKCCYGGRGWGGSGVCLCLCVCVCVEGGGGGGGGGGGLGAGSNGRGR